MIADVCNKSKDGKKMNDRKIIVLALVLCAQVPLQAGDRTLPPLPTGRVPFARGAEFAPRPVAFSARAFAMDARLPRSKVQTNLYPWAEYRCGDKVLLANGYDGGVNWCDQTGFGRVVLYSGLPTDAKPGRERILSLSIRIPGAKAPLSKWNDAWPDDFMTVDAAAKSVVWHRPYVAPDGTRRDFTYRLSPAGDGKVNFDYDLGVGDEAAARTNALAAEFRVSFGDNAMVTNAAYGFNDENYVLAKREVMREFDKDKTYTLYKQLTFAEPVRFHMNRNDEPRHFELAFADGALPACTVEDGLRDWNDPAKAWRSFCFFWRVGGKAKDPAKANVKGRIVIDFGKSTVPVAGERPPTGGIDFWGQDALDVPKRPGGNLVVNGSFEQGLSGWAFAGGGANWNDVVANGGRPLEEIVADARTGRKALKFRKLERPAAEALISLPMALEPDVPHVLSVWTKGPKGATLWISPDPAQQKGRIGWIGDKAPRRNFSGSDGWTRHEIPFVPKTGDCLVSLRGGGDMLVDDVRVEKGEKTSDAPAMSPVVANLVTSDPDNDVSAGAPLAAKLELAFVRPAAGRVDVRIRNFYNETVFRRTFDFTAQTESLPLELDAAALGTGVFVVGTDFDVGGERWRGDCQRLAITDPLHGRHGIARFFVQFPWYEKGSRGETIARRTVERGIGSTTWTQNFRFTNGTATAALARKYGIVNRLHCLSSELAHRHPAEFGWRKTGLKAYTNATPEKLAFIEDEAYLAGRNCEADDRWWALWNEEEAAMPFLKDALDPKKTSARDRDAAFDTYFRFQHACWKGLKRAFDERGLKLMYAPTHGPCNYNPGGNNRPLLENFLAAAARQGFRYDFIATHTYHAIDGSVLGKHDRDANADALYACLKRFGYPDTTPIMFSEGFNMLPFYIPAWRATGWADDYYGQPPSEDLGAREFLQAATMARLYVMDLKRWPRVMTSHTWQHRPVLDARLAPYMWTKVPNTLGHLLGDPRFHGQVVREGWRAYVFHQGDHAVAAVWANAADVENGLKPGPTLSVKLPSDAQFYDLMGNRRRAERKEDGSVALPLTAAPLFVTAEDAAALLAALEG